MNVWLKIISVIFILLIIYELVLTYTRYIKRRRVFSIAKSFAESSGKPLMVIGDPWNGSTNKIFGPSYECGDVCIDLTGCPNCIHGIKSKIENYLPSVPSDSYVIFISCVLEYVDSGKIDYIFSEIQRVSGGDYYIVSVEPWTLTALLYPTRLITGEGNPNQIIYTDYPNKILEYRVI